MHHRDTEGTEKDFELLKVTGASESPDAQWFDGVFLNASNRFRLVCPPCEREGQRADISGAEVNGKDRAHCGRSSYRRRLLIGVTHPAALRDFHGSLVESAILVWWQRVLMAYRERAVFEQRI